MKRVHLIGVVVPVVCHAATAQNSGCPAGLAGHSIALSGEPLYVIGRNDGVDTFTAT